MSVQNTYINCCISNPNYMVKTMEKKCQLYQCLPTIFLGLQMEILPEVKIPENNVQF